MNVHAHTLTQTCPHAHGHGHTHRRIHTHIDMDAHLYTLIYVHKLYTSIHAPLFIPIYIRTQLCTLAYIYTHTPIYIHTHIYTGIHTHPYSPIHNTHPYAPIHNTHQYTHWHCGRGEHTDLFTAACPGAGAGGGGGTPLHAWTSWTDPLPQRSTLQREQLVQEAWELQCKFMDQAVKEAEQMPQQSGSTSERVIQQLLHMVPQVRLSICGC